MFTTLVKLTENDKRIIIALCLALIIVLVVVGYLVVLTRRIMRKQGDAVNAYMADIMKARLITKPKEFRKVATSKSYVRYFRKTWLCITITAVLVLTLLIYGWATKDNGLTYVKTALEDLSFTLKDWPTSNFFGLNIVSGWPSINHVPDFSWNFGKYITLFVMIGLLVTVFKYIHNTLALMARRLRIMKITSSRIWPQYIDAPTNFSLMHPSKDN